MQNEKELNIELDEELKNLTELAKEILNKIELKGGAALFDTEDLDDYRLCAEKIKHLYKILEKGGYLKGFDILLIPNLQLPDDYGFLE